MNKVRLGLLSLAASMAFLVLQPANAQQQQPPAQERQREQTSQQQPATAPAPAMLPRQSVTEDMLFRDNSKIVGRVSIPDEKLSYLEQPQGRTWRQFHEKWAPWILGAAVLLTLLVLLLLYLLRGPQRFVREGAPVYVIRYKAYERFNHWMTAVSFVVLALTGLNYVFGKRLLMPLIGPGAFGDVTQIAKYAHNFFAWPFVLGVLVMIVVWSRDNLFRAEDREWLRAGGGLFGQTRHISAGRFNAGQKNSLLAGRPRHARQFRERTDAPAAACIPRCERDAGVGRDPHHRRRLLHRDDPRAHLCWHRRDRRRLHRHGDGRSGPRMGASSPRSVGARGRARRPRDGAAGIGRPRPPHSNQKLVEEPAMRRTRLAVVLMASCGLAGPALASNPPADICAELVGWLDQLQAQAAQPAPAQQPAGQGATNQQPANQQQASQQQGGQQTAGPGQDAAPRRDLNTAVEQAKPAGSNAPGGQDHAQTTSGMTGPVTSAGPGAAGPQGGAQESSKSGAANPQAAEQKPAQGAEAAKPGEPPKPAAAAQARPADPKAPPPDPKAVEKARQSAQAHDVQSCRSVVRDMRLAGVALPGPLIALAALRPDYAAAGQPPGQAPVQQGGATQPPGPAPGLPPIPPSGIPPARDAGAAPR